MVENRVEYEEGAPAMGCPFVWLVAQRLCCTLLLTCGALAC
jgi:hypothetical protein